MNAGPDVPGRVEITARALTSLARAVAAEGLGAPAKRVRVGLGDASGALSLDITGPIAASDDIVSGSIRIADQVKGRVSDLTGRRVGSAHIELTGIVREHESRAR
ncbi:MULTISPECIES: hypothetical protein [Curtobacterium]|uniref:Uncharacterized protein n=2 Tax=Curtobacterium TaxID=2034 RepID=A0A9Q2W1X3_9MICO|nr:MULTISPECIES: hypothetical protein [Curtobacterium]EYT66913.1 hypothetical protein H489_0100170 [Curtobacterium flaccumfaciens UCD-AKU]KIQ06136.1 hypothetical protein RU06_12420 [Curtobacterium flaccumfaciens]KQR31186.1 hypothetical protein ASF75_07075 [Curtobacterium sp. Leaf154]MBB1197866.1 hypothetical protein [Curtobacterium flaccumfaciens]MBF4595267.1 hypothetical protein [Curtobacterium flaccumfaciens]